MVGKQVKIDEGHAVWLAPPEYVIIRKLEYYREGRSQKHIHDIRGMLEISSDLIDMDIVSEWIEKRSLGHAWREVEE